MRARMILDVLTLRTRLPSARASSRLSFSLSLALSVSLLAACVGDTGGRTYDFPVAAAGPLGATAPLTCSDDVDVGWSITLSEATLHIGGIYLNQSQSVSGAQATGCFLPGTYVAQQTGARDVDLLSPTPQLFPLSGHGIDQPAARVGEVWLTRGPINDVPSARPIAPVLTVRGVATPRASSAAPIAFSGTVTLESAYQTTGLAAGGDPICKKRIVSLIPAPITFRDTGGLLLRVDPCLFFLGVDFTQLVPGDDDGTGNRIFTFSDDPTADDYALSGGYLYGNLHSTAPYSFSWSEELSP